MSAHIENRVAGSNGRSEQGKLRTGVAAIFEDLLEKKITSRENKVAFDPWANPGIG